MSTPAIVASYQNPEFVNAVEVGLRVLGRFDTKVRFVNEQGQLVLIDADDNNLIFQAFRS